MKHRERTVRFFGAVLAFTVTGCAVRRAVVPPPTAPPPAAVSHPPRDLMIFVPQTDDGAAQWLNLFTHDPKLRMVIAMSPRFQRFAKDAALRQRVQELEKAGRLELAVQMPNPPILPLLIDTNSAKDALPPGSPLPNPPFAYPDDVIQLIARAKADYFRTWHILPHGIVLPYGASNDKLLALFDRLGFTWMAAALGAPAADGPYRSSSFFVWDSTPTTTATTTRVHLWDERQMKDPAGSLHVLRLWAKTAELEGRSLILPSDADLAASPLPIAIAWGRRTWTTRDWSPWIGQPKKNAAWVWLRKTREALEHYKNSGRASVGRLDAAFEEIYAAESATYFGAIGNEMVLPGVAQDREHEFQATLSGVYRLMAQNPPEDLFAEESGAAASLHGSSTTVTAELLPGGVEHVVIDDAAGDDRGDGTLAIPASVVGSFDLRRVEVWASSDTVTWAVSLGAPSGGALTSPGGSPMVDIYIDLNGQPNVGTASFLPGRKASPSPKDAWEYALVVSPPSAQLYRTQGGAYDLADAFPVSIQGATLQVAVPRNAMRGSPRRWAYQALVMDRDPRSSADNPQPLDLSTDPAMPPIIDLIDPPGVSQAELLRSIAAGQRNDIPFIRVKTK